VCLTVVDKGPGWLAFDVSGETISRTAAGNGPPAAASTSNARSGSATNWAGISSPAMSTASARSSVDRGRRIAPRRHRGRSRDRALCRAQGLDHRRWRLADRQRVRDTAEGVEFDLNIIPHTAAVTTFADLTVGQAVNLEIDVLARYLQRMEALRAKS
jgi:riboflavin synthase